jgi:hypothetical protein
MRYSSWLPIFVIPAGVALYACGSLDSDPNYGYNALNGKSAPVVVPPAGSSSACKPIDAGTCPVKYAEITEIFKAGASVQKNCFNCHTRDSPPKMIEDDASATWESLRNQIGSSRKVPYINPCSQDPDASYILDNVSGSSTERGGQGMPKGTQLAPDEVDKIRTWVQCGAPLN